jgi:hypothetical protein
MHNLVFGWVLYGLATLTALIWVGALSLHLEYRRSLPQGTSEKRDNGIITAMVFTIATVVILVFWVIS